MTVDQVGALIHVAMAIDHQIHTGLLQYRQEIFTGLFHPATTMTFIIRVICPSGIGWVMKQHDHPTLFGLLDILLYPIRHWRLGRQIIMMVIQ